MEIKVVNELRDDIKVFKSLEEFDLFYQKNKDSMNGQTTQMLNKLYKIELPDGSLYRITKKNCGSGKGKTLIGDICLKKVTTQKDDEQPLWEIAIESVKADITNMRSKIEEIKQTVNQVVKVINEMNQIQQQKY